MLPEDAAWFIDGMLLIRCLKPKTCKKWISALIKFIIQDSFITVKLLGFINDTYQVDFIKNMSSTLQVLNII